jgi:hypothetical protein
MAVAFSVVGDAREMHPIVRDEVYRIGYEAIRNACTHSGASQLEVELRYAHNLALRVSDNGIGIDPAIADRGKDGHFGLQRMRERAARIGGNLTLGSSSNSGTEIRLLVPGDIVFRKRRQFTGHCLQRSKSSLSGWAAEIERIVDHEELFHVHRRSKPLLACRMGRLSSVIHSGAPSRSQ